MLGQLFLLSSMLVGEIAAGKAGVLASIPRSALAPARACGNRCRRCRRSGTCFLQPNIVLNSVECFDPASHKWEALAPMPFPRCCHASVALSGRLYICGGQLSFGIRSLENVEESSRWKHPPEMAESVQFFGPESGSWETLPKTLMKPRSFCVAITVSI